MSYRPITDFWWLARPKVSYHGAYPAGFLERARALLGVHIEAPVLHVCGGRVRAYPYQERAVGPNDATIDLDAELSPDFLFDVRQLGVKEGDRFPWWRANVGAEPCNPPPWGRCGVLDRDAAERLQAHPGYLWHGALIDRPYTSADHAEYAVEPGTFPHDLNDLLRRTLSVVRPGARVGVLDYYLPRPPQKVDGSPIKFVAAVAVLAGFGNRVRVFSVFERVAPNVLPETEEVMRCPGCLSELAGSDLPLDHTCSTGSTGSTDGALVQPTTELLEQVDELLNRDEEATGDAALDGF